MFWDGLEAVPPHLSALRSQVNEVAADMYEPTTWEQRTSLLRGFQSFCLEAGLPLNLDAVPVFLESKELKYSTKVQYGTTLKSLLTREIAVVDAYLAGCRKREAKEEVRQAAPITPADMRALVEGAPSWADATVMQLAWMTASRWGEVKDLRGENLLPQPDGSVILDWAAIPKTAKINPYRAHRYVKLQGPMAQELRKLKAQVGESGKLTGLTTTQIAQRLRERGYSAHSIKRGALQSAAQLAQEHALPPRSVVALAKHADPLDIPTTTVRYMGPKTTELTNSHVLPGLLDRLVFRK
ncbi:putative trans-sialidase [Leptomonas pyrrhocoris]|uniref:Putative trans-sialidase n=1 Tax=Leptomonas pyrrhocoris TaxID=157538 RepID=A0A0M9G3Z6_LEPPY|nr:putative trans-sialidase [Leptomonas pyrrhocoris]XP_015652149.1 putative trans-sialidase [Leptomonas pyrrhocoris]XP_015652464.1 putative trans-sialidase [Leptomonas pyrrhocoris]XP_015652468.1 putative trans-sialidase [Leptomonas pyrrhocoris]XP_015652655.1 putative trans-sialidase [Leptomonas pyrrhocoris]XP_015653933.1 putative trans-sialidase [Leptomonas pyrrhocoris]XP_015659859.1 putative trans-sialidase [Leptomonas pyrrhocoris]XP_015660085.1 putative trans-sialidase [Leptomonas pyrrhoco|eukprot:XP_015651783.1 putative trans-sialidase [Leptomonas pyrrhocoris]